MGFKQLVQTCLLLAFTNVLVSCNNITKTTTVRKMDSARGFHDYHYDDHMFDKGLYGGGGFGVIDPLLSLLIGILLPISLIGLFMPLLTMIGFGGLGGNMFGILQGGGISAIPASTIATGRRKRRDLGHLLTTLEKALTKMK